MADLDGRPIPVAVLTGFLGSGKTSVLNHLVRQTAFRRALVLINEFGSIGLDHDLITPIRDDVVVAMSSGCLCCTLRGDLVKTLRAAPTRFARDGKIWFDRVIIETTGLADPAPILQTLMTDTALAQRYRLGSVVTTIDAVNGLDTLAQHAEAMKQVAVADSLLLTKTDLVDHAGIERIEQRLHELNPAAAIEIACFGALTSLDPFADPGVDWRDPNGDVERWLRTEAYAADHLHVGVRDTDERHPHAHEHEGHDPNRHAAHIRALCVSFEEPIAGPAFDSWLDLLMALRGRDLLRIKGIVNIAGCDRPLVIHGVQHIFHPPLLLDRWPSSDQRTRIVFITRDIDEALLRDSLAVFDDAATSL